MHSNSSQIFAALSALAVFSGVTPLAHASDHLDSPATVADPQADISDVYAWTSTDGRQLNLVMTVLGHTFSNKTEYVLHIDSGRDFGHTRASTTIKCSFPTAAAINCKLGDADSVSGSPGDVAGLQGKNQLFRVYAGLMDDPFYNNIKGLVAAYQTAGDAIKGGATVDAAGCAHFDESTANGIRDQMTHTDGATAQNFLGNWTVSAIVISVDLPAVSKGGPMLAVWATTSAAGKQLDRMARPFVTNTLLGVAPFSTDDASGLRRQKYNEAPGPGAASFVADLEKSLAFQDSLDGKCGNQLLAGAKESSSRYREMARLFADDRLWVNSASTVCTQFFAAELASLAGQKQSANDCGGRSPTYDTPNVWRSLLIAGAGTGINDGLREDEHRPSATVFPFLAPPDAHRVDH